MSKILVIFRVPEMSVEQYDSVIKELEENGYGKIQPRIFHSCSLLEKGTMVVDVWESKEILEKFFETLGPILGKNGVYPPPPEIYEVHNIIN